MNPIIGQYVYGYVPYIGDCYGIYEIAFISNHYFAVYPVISIISQSRASKRQWLMPKSAITTVFDTTDLNIIKQQYPELFI